MLGMKEESDGSAVLKYESRNILQSSCCGVEEISLYIESDDY